MKMLMRSFYILLVLIVAYTIFSLIYVQPALAQRHRVVDPGVPRVAPMTPDDPYFPMSGLWAWDIVSGVRHKYTLHITAFPRIAESPHVHGSDVVLPIWRAYIEDGQTKYCAVQTILLPAIPGATRDIDLVMLYYNKGDAIMVETAYGYQVDFMEDGKLVMRFFPMLSSAPAPVQIFGVKNQCAF